MLIGLRWIDSAHDPWLKSGPVYSTLSQYLVFNEKWLALSVFKHKSCIKFSFRSTFTASRGFLSAIALETITLPSSLKSVVIKNTQKHFIWARFLVQKSDVSLSKAQEILIEYFFVIKVLKISNSKHQLVLNFPRKLTADPACSRKAAV